MNERQTRGPWWIVPVALAGVLIAAFVVGSWRPGEFVVLGRLDRPGLFGTAAFGLLALAAWLAFRAQRLATREWDLGCVNAEIEKLTRVEWLGTNELRVHLSQRGPIDFVLDEFTGRPDETLSVGC